MPHEYLSVLACSHARVQLPSSNGHDDANYVQKTRQATTERLHVQKLLLKTSFWDATMCRVLLDSAARWPL